MAKAKMNQREAVKILANEIKAIRNTLTLMMKELEMAKGATNEILALFENYITFKKDDKKFLKHIETMLAENDEVKETEVAK